MDWFYAKHGKQEGPVDLETLRAKLKGGEIIGTDLVWREGMGEWTPAAEVAELTAAEASSPAAPETAGPVPAPQQAPTQPQGGMAMQPQAGMQPNMVAPPTSGLAIASMVCGIVGIMLCYFNGLLALPAVICGHMAIKQIDKSMTPIGGRGMAIAGLVTGYIGLAFQLFFIVVIGIAIASEM